MQNRVYMETALVIPSRFVNETIKELHVKLGHPGQERLWIYCLAHFHSAHPKEARAAVKTITEACDVCGRVKINKAEDRGVEGVLPVPTICNQEVAIDLIHLSGHSTDGDNRLLFMMDTLSGYVAAIPTTSSVNEEEVAHKLWAEWIQPYGAPARVTADNDIRWTSQRGTWSRLLAYYHVDMHLSTPYRSQSNGRCERKIQEFNRTMRVLKLEFPEEPLLKLLPLAIATLNAQPRLPAGLTAAEMFMGQSMWMGDKSRPPPSFVAEFDLAKEKTRDAVIKARERYRRHLGNVQRQREGTLKVGDYVYVHSKRFPCHPRGKFDPPWSGP